MARTVDMVGSMSSPLERWGSNFPSSSTLYSEICAGTWLLVRLGVLPHGQVRAVRAGWHSVTTVKTRGASKQCCCHTTQPAADGALWKAKATRLQFE